LLLKVSQIVGPPTFLWDWQKFAFCQSYVWQKIWGIRELWKTLNSVISDIKVYDQWSGKSRAMRNWNGALNWLSNAPSGTLFFYRKSSSYSYRCFLQSWSTTESFSFGTFPLTGMTNYLKTATAVYPMIT
jgi:hypothetical protein